MGHNACWNGYAYDYSMWYGPGMIYGYCYGEIEDYLIEYTIPIKEIFPSDKHHMIFFLQVKNMMEQLD